MPDNTIGLAKFEIADVRIDAFTASSSITGDRLKSKIFVNSLCKTLDDMYFYFEQSKPITSNGARGWVKGSLRYMAKYDKNDKTKMLWCATSVTGERSEDAFQLAISYDEDFKCTRLDIAVDIAYNVPQLDFLPQIYNTNKKWQDSLKMIRSASGDTLYVNSRESGKMGRIYDKSDYYNLKQGCVYRFEIEAKKIDAEKLKMLLRSQVDTKRVMLDYATKVFKNWAIPIPTNGNMVIMPRLHAVASSDAQKLEWLTTIGGAIRGLVERGYEKQVREILNLHNTESQLTLQA